MARRFKPSRSWSKTRNSVLNEDRNCRGLCQSVVVPRLNSNVIRVNCNLSDHERCPTCLYIVMKSKLFQASTIFPFSIRTIVMPVNSTGA